MVFQFHPYFVVLTISASVTLAAFIITRQRTAPGSVTLSAMLFGMFVWGISYALSWMVVPLNYKIFFLKVMFFGVVMMPGLFLFFVLQITHREHWITFRNILLVFVIPALTLAVVWFVPQLVYRSIELGVNDGYYIAKVARGWWFWGSTVYSYAVILFAFILLGTSYYNANPFFKRQYMIILLGSIVPFSFSFFTQLNSSTLDDVDLSPISFGVAGVVYVYAIFRHQFMDLVPVARGHLIENMPDGVIVLDVRGRIVDINPAMENFLDAPAASFIGKNVSEAINIWNESTKHLLTGSENTRTELRLPNKISVYLDLRVTPLYNRDQQLSGRLIVFRDVTERREVERDLRLSRDRLQTQLIEIGLLQSQLREQAIRDSLTNVFNRRYMEETLDRELARAAREVYPLCIVMMDIDHFKKVNDTYGHEAGDVVLKTLSNMLTNQSRQGDFVCRYGGEEFVLVMPNIGLEVAKGRANSLLGLISSLFVPLGRFNLNITVSMGISCFPEHGETKDELLRMADKALYAAKNNGRNCVEVYQE